MQKKITALAIIGLMAASLPAIAQSKLEIYGVVDMGLSWRGDNIDKNIGNRHAIESGQSAGDRLGFRGVEDLGNGLKAGFVLEQGIHTDRGVSSQGGRTFGRQSYFSLGGHFGTISMGYQYAPHHILGTTVDPFDTGTVGEYNNVFFGEVRIDNLVAYTSPSWNGFSFIAGYSANAINDESIGNKNGDVRVYALAPVYQSGPWFIALNLQEARLKEKGQKDDKIRVYDFFSSYDFDYVKIAFAYGKRKVDNSDYLIGFDHGQDSKQWMIGATIPLGTNKTHKILSSYTHRKTELYNIDASDAKVSQWAIGYEYSLSKRTTFYAVYSDLSNNRSAKEYTLFGDAADAIHAGYGYQRGVSLGIRHAF